MTPGTQVLTHRRQHAHRLTESVHCQSGKGNVCFTVMPGVHTDRYPHVTNEQPRAFAEITSTLCTEGTEFFKVPSCMDSKLLSEESEPLVMAEPVTSGQGARSVIALVHGEFAAAP